MQDQNNLKNRRNKIKKKMSEEQNFLLGRGVRFDFYLKPKIPEEHVEDMKAIIYNNLGLNQYFDDIDVGIFDAEEPGYTQIKLFCPSAKFKLKPTESLKFYKELYKQVEENIMNGFREGGRYKCVPIKFAVLEILHPGESEDVYIPPLTQEEIDQIEMAKP